jgi:hypothetical protein
MCEWTWYRCLRPNQVGGWEPSSHHLLLFFCWFTTWPGRSIRCESSVGWRAQEHAENGCADLGRCRIYLENSLSWVQSMLMWVSWTLHCITRLQRVGSILCSVAGATENGFKFVVRSFGMLCLWIYGISNSSMWNLYRDVSSWLPCGWTCLIVEALFEHYVRSTRVPWHLAKQIQMEGMIMWLHHEQLV